MSYHPRRWFIHPTLGSTWKPCRISCKFGSVGLETREWYRHFLSWIVRESRRESKSLRERLWDLLFGVGNVWSVKFDWVKCKKWGSHSRCENVRHYVRVSNLMSWVNKLRLLVRHNLCKYKLWLNKNFVCGNENKCEVVINVYVNVRE